MNFRIMFKRLKMSYTFHYVIYSFFVQNRACSKLNIHIETFFYNMF